MPAKPHSPGDVPIIVVGASAGGLDALKKFLAAVPAEAGLAFVLVPHLDPRHRSLMVELLAKHFSIPVHEAAHRERIRGGHAYVIPPNKYLAIKHGTIHLCAPPTMHDLPGSQQRIRSVLDAATDAIVTIDARGTIQTFSKGAEAMFGYSAGEAIGQNVSLLMGSPYRENHAGYLRRYLETREPRLLGRTRELRARRKNGEEFPIQLSVTEVPALGLYMGIIRDVTEQRALQEEIVRIATLEQRRIGEELHDNTQQELTGLGLLAETLSDSLRRNGSAEAAVAAKLAAGIAETNRRLRALAKGLVPVPVDREGLMVALGDLARRTEEEHGIECRFVCPKPVKVADDAAALHLYRIAQEAVTNAVRHASASAISVDLHADDRQLRLEIRDDGVGLDPQRRHGDGLGLRIMEHRCGLLGGQFTVREEEAGGTTIACVVPKPPGGPG